MSDKTAKADITPVRQRTQYTCMSTSMAMCLQALGHDVTEDEVNRVMGARPMKGASWEQALACAQHYGCRATLTMPSTVKQLREWTDAGSAVMIAWNPEGRDWSHASTVFDVTDELPSPVPAHCTVISDKGSEGPWVWVADPNIPNPEKTVRICSQDDFYSKWFEKWPDYLVRRPACAIEREITPQGRQVMASRVAAEWPTASLLLENYAADPSGYNKSELSDWGINTFRVGASEQGYSRSDMEAILKEEARRVRGLKGTPEGLRAYTRMNRAGSEYRLTRQMRVGLFCQFVALGVVPVPRSRMAATVTVKKLRSGEVVVNAGPSSQTSAKRLLERAGWDWRLVKDQWGSWIFPKGTDVDDLLKTLSGVDAELRLAASRVAEQFMTKLAEPYDCYRDGLRGRALADCYMRFPYDLGPSEIGLIQKHYPGWYPPRRGPSGPPPALKEAIHKNLLAFGLQGAATKNFKSIEFLKDLNGRGGTLSPKQQQWLAKIIQANTRYTRNMPDGVVILTAYRSGRIFFDLKKSSASAKRWVEQNAYYEERSDAWLILGSASDKPKEAPAAPEPAPAAPSGGSDPKLKAKRLEVLGLVLNKFPNDSFLQGMRKLIENDRPLSDKQLSAIRRKLYMSRMKPEADHFRTAHTLDDVLEMVTKLARAKRKKKPLSQKDRMKIDKTPEKHRDPAARALAERGNSGGGRHHTRDRDVEKGHSRKDKHKKDWRDKEGASNRWVDMGGRSFDVGSRVEYWPDPRARSWVAPVVGFDRKHLLVGDPTHPVKIPLNEVSKHLRLKRGSYSGNPDGKPIYPNEIDHGTNTEPLAGGTDVMRRLQNKLIHEQGDVVPQRPESPKVARYSFDRQSLCEAAARVASAWTARQENN